MISNLSKRLALSMLGLASITNFLASANNVHGLHESPWHFIEHTFIIKPKQQAQSFLPRGLRWSTAGLTGFGGYKLAEAGITTYFPGCGNLVLRSISGLTAGASALMTNALLYHLMVKHYEHQALETFIEDWHDNNKHTPSSLKEAFDTLYKHYKKDRLEESSKAEALFLIKEAVYRCFPQKYSSPFARKRLF